MLFACGVATLLGFTFFRLENNNTALFYRVAVVFFTVGEYLLVHASQCRGYGGSLCYAAHEPEYCRTSLAAVMASVTILNVMAPLINFRSVRYRELESGFYRPAPIFWATAACEIPFAAVSALIFAVIFYPVSVHQCRRCVLRSPQALPCNSLVVVPPRSELV